MFHQLWEFQNLHSIRNCRKDIFPIQKLKTLTPNVWSVHNVMLMELTLKILPHNSISNKNKKRFCKKNFKIKFCLCKRKQHTFIDKIGCNIFCKCLRKRNKCGKEKQNFTIFYNYTKVWVYFSSFFHTTWQSSSLVKHGENKSDQWEL